jgi:general secretion pathway protein E
VRLSCPQCSVEQAPPRALIEASGLARTDLSTFRFRHGAGCGHCRGTGFKGRRAIAETLTLDDTLRDLMAERAPLSRIRQAARQAGLVTLREAAVTLVAQGGTTLEEINRVTPIE